MDPEYTGKEVVHEIGTPFSQHAVPPSRYHIVNEPINTHPATQVSRQPDARTVCGFQRLTFWLLAALIIAMIAAAVAACVGGTIAASKSHQVQHLQTQLVVLQSSFLHSPSSCLSASSSSTSSSSPATLTGPVATSVSYVALDCPAINGKTYYSIGGSAFITYCSTNYQNGGPDITGSGIVKDIASLIAYSINDCMDMCVGFNDGRNNFGSGGTCAAVSFVANMSLWLNEYAGNCFLKSLLGARESAEFWIASAAMM